MSHGAEIGGLCRDMSSVEGLTDEFILHTASNSYCSLSKINDSSFLTFSSILLRDRCSRLNDMLIIHMQRSSLGCDFV